MEHFRLLEQPNAVLGKCSREGEKRSRSEQEKAELLKSQWGSMIFMCLKKKNL